MNSWTTFIYVQLRRVSSLSQEQHRRSIWTETGLYAERLSTSNSDPTCSQYLRASSSSASAGDWKGEFLGTPFVHHRTILPVMHLSPCDNVSFPTHPAESTHCTLSGLRGCWLDKTQRPFVLQHNGHSIADLLGWGTTVWLAIRVITTIYLFRFIWWSATYFSTVQEDTNNAESVLRESWDGWRGHAIGSSSNQITLYYSVYGCDKGARPAFIPLLSGFDRPRRYKQLKLKGVGRMLGSHAESWGHMQEWGWLDQEDVSEHICAL